MAINRLASAENEYPLAGPIVEGLRVGNRIDNQDSIEASLDDYEVLEGVRVVSWPLEASKPGRLFYAADDIRRCERLAEIIKASGRISPLIVIVGADGDPYILEGGHRLGALHLLGKTAFPALVVLDLVESDSEVKKSAAITPADRTLYHGSNSIEFFSDLKPDKYGIIWLAEQPAADMYAHTHYRKGESRVYEVTLRPGTSIVDLRDLTQPISRKVYERVSAERQHGMGAFTEEEWPRYCDFGIIESYRWLRSWLRSHKVDGVILTDAHGATKHESVALLNRKTVVKTTVVGEVPEPEGRVSLTASAQPNSTIPIIRSLTREEAVAIRTKLNDEGKNKGFGGYTFSIHEMPETEYLEVWMPLVLIDYDKQNPEREKEYADRTTDLPPIYVNYTERARKKGKRQVWASDGNHRCCAAELRGETKIRAIMEARAYGCFLEAIHSGFKIAAATLTLYRGVSQHNEGRGGKFYTKDKEWARQFTQSGLDKEIISATIALNAIYRPEELPYGGDPDAIDQAVLAAREAGCKALWCDEGQGEPPSVYVFERSALKRAANAEIPSFNEFFKHFGGNIDNFFGPSTQADMDEQARKQPGFTDASREEQKKILFTHKYEALAKIYRDWVGFHADASYPRTVYRAVKVPDIASIRSEDAGRYWSWDEDYARVYDGTGKGEVHVLRGLIDMVDIDWLDTIKANMEFDGNGVEEREVRLKKGSKVHITGVRRKKAPADAPWESLASGHVTAAAKKKAPATETPAFKAWFGESQIVDNQGQPLVVFHGTASKFDVFENKPGYRGDGGMFEWESNSPFKFFTTDQDFAHTFAKAKAEHPSDARVLAFYLKMERPLDMRTPKGRRIGHKLFDLTHQESGSVAQKRLDHWNAVCTLEGLPYRAPTTGHTRYVRYDASGNAIGASSRLRPGYVEEQVSLAEAQKWHQEEIEEAKEEVQRLEKALEEAIEAESEDYTSTWGPLDEPNAADKLKAAGYDGVILVENNKTTVSYAVPDANQIKSVKNAGTFDPNNHSVTASAGIQFPSFEEVSKALDFHEMYGYDEDLEGDEDEQWEELKRTARADYDDLTETFSAWEFPLNLYRVLVVKDPSQINTDKLGVYWSYTDIHGGNFGENFSSGYVLRAQVQYPSAINWLDTLRANMVNRHETEVTLDSGETLEVTGIRKHNRKGDGEWKPFHTKTVTAAGPQTPVTETPAFKAWFAGSKCVDAQGSPLRVFHGTSATFDSFDPKESYDGGFHFGTPEAANTRLKHNDNPPGQHILPVYLSIKRPKRLADDPFDEDSWAEEIHQAKEKGFDGIVYPNRIEGGESWVAFHPNQIKSAIGNSGAFDSGSNSITASPDFGYTKFVNKDDAIAQLAIKVVPKPSGHFQIVCESPDGEQQGRIAVAPTYIAGLPTETTKGIIRMAETLPEWKGTGLGQMLYDAAIVEAKKRGMKTLRSDDAGTRSPDAEAAWRRLSKRYSVTYNQELDHWVMDLTSDPGSNSITAAAKTAPGGKKPPAKPLIDQTETPGFKTWFAGSKAVDEDGKPVRVYHGTKGSFDSFDTNGGEGKTHGTGTFFSSDSRIAETYGTTIMPVYLKLMNPLVVQAVNIKGKSYNWQHIGKDAYVEGEDGGQEDLFDLFGVYNDEDKDASTDDIAHLARKMGRDGAIIRNVKDFGSLSHKAKSDVYVAFYPNQIKSAIGNSGAFDPGSNSITAAAERSISSLVFEFGEFEVGGDASTVGDWSIEALAPGSMYPYREGLPSATVRVGYIQCGKPETEETSQTILVYDVNVNDDWRGTGLGQMLYDKAIQKAKELGARVFESSIDRTPEANRAWKRLRQRYPVRFNRKENVYRIPLTPGSNSITAAATPVTETPAFKAWFAGSKCVDGAGKPLRVYHGTSQVFSEFDDAHSGRASGHQTSKLGFFFTEDSAIAEVFLPPGEPYGEGANIVPCFLNIKNPALLSSEDFVEWFCRGKRSVEAYRKTCIAKGHDGVRILKAEGESYGYSDDDPDPSGYFEYSKDQWAAFYPNQIKSAIGNSGAFDPGSKSITAAAPQTLPTLEQLATEFGGTLQLADNLLEDRGEEVGDDHAKVKWVEARYRNIAASLNRLTFPRTVYRSVVLTGDNTSVDATNLDTTKLGVYWAVELSAAEPHWGDLSSGNEWTFSTTISADQVDWLGTMLARMNYVMGDDEEELRLKPGARLLDVKCSTDGEQWESLGQRSITAAPRTPVTETPAFKAWFAGSRVVDEAGKPLVVYHGTSADFEAFDPSLKGRSSNKPHHNIEGVMWFAASPHGANFFAGEGEGAHVKPLYLRMTNPRIADAATFPRIRDQYFKSKGKVVYDIEDIKGREIQEARRDGNDGVIFLNGYDGTPGSGTVYAIFKPNQIKSAIGNSGAFDSGSNSITAAVKTASGSYKHHGFYKDGKLFEVPEDDTAEFQDHDHIAYLNGYDSAADMVSDGYIRFASYHLGGLPMFSLQIVDSEHARKAAIKLLKDYAHPDSGVYVDLQNQSGNGLQSWHADNVLKAIGRLRRDPIATVWTPPPPYKRKSGNKSITAAAGVWYHGSKTKFDRFEVQSKALVTEEVTGQPIFLSPSKDFARLNAGHRDGWIYTVEANVENTFDGAYLVDANARYYMDPETFPPLGQKVYAALENNEIYPDGDEYALGYFEALAKRDWDATQSPTFCRWLQANGFDSFLEVGDGELNIGVFDPRRLKIISVEPAHKSITAAGKAPWNPPRNAKTISYPKPKTQGLTTFYADYLPEYHVGCIYMIDMHPQAEGKGIASSTVRDFETWVAAQGGTKVIGDSFPGATGFWKKLGYDVAAQTHLCAGDPDGVDVYRISKRLSEKPKQAAGMVGPKRYHFVTDCTSSDGDSIHALQEAAEGVDYKELAANVAGLPEFEQSLGYGPNGSLDLELADDWSVGFYKSVYRGVPCYYIEHSHIEHVFTLDGQDPEPLPEEPDDEPGPKTASVIDPDDDDYRKMEEFRASLTFPLTVYRAISTNLNRLDTEHLGESWSPDERHAQPYYGSQRHAPLVVRGVINEDAVDWEGTFFQNVEYRWSEHEIRIRPGAHIELTGVKEGREREFKAPPVKSAIAAVDANGQRKRSKLLQPPGKLAAADPYLYHATYGVHRQQIEREGLHGNSSNKNYEDSQKGKVYLAELPEVAYSYAEASDDVPEHYLDHIITYKIHKRDLDPTKLKKDSNVLGDGGTLEYTGTIHPKHLKIHSEYEGAEKIGKRSQASSAAREERRS